MARTAQTKLIGETNYTVNQLSPTPSLDLLHDLAKLLGPSLAPIFANIGSLKGLLDKEVSETKFDFLGDAVRALASSADKETTKRIIKTLASVTVIEGTGRLDAVFEVHFAKTGIAEMFKWAFFALQTQYDDFFDVLGSAIGSVPLRGQKTPQ